MRDVCGSGGSSMLHAVSLPELATESLEEYEALASELAGNRYLLRSIRRRLEPNRAACAFFDTARMCRLVACAGSRLPVSRWRRFPMHRAEDRNGRRLNRTFLRARCFGWAPGRPLCSPLAPSSC